MDSFIQVFASICAIGLLFFSGVLGIGLAVIVVRKLMDWLD